LKRRNDVWSCCCLRQYNVVRAGTDRDRSDKDCGYKETHISSAGLETVPLYHSGIVLVDKNGAAGV